ncbi:MAG: FAD-dependent oxidoreductase [Pirellulaceae bacterium]
MSRLFSPVFPVLFTIFSLHLTIASLQAGERINESAREIPIAADVDVVVVGGSTGAVSAAVAAAGEGASVFLAAPHPYLGEDMAATLQLWLEPNEEPRGSLARKIYDDPLQNAIDPNRLEFSYEADTPSADIHADTSPPTRLTDGKWSDAASQSVQYDRDTTIVAELESVQPVKRVQLMFYRRREASEAGDGFDVASIDVHVSDDKQSWTKVGATKNEDESSESWGTLSVPVGREARYVKLDVTIAPPHERMLLGELLITGPDVAADEAENKSPTPPRPMHVKKVLDDALLDADVSYLYSCLATDVLRDRSGKPCGIVMANRAGRQAVIAKQVIDATMHAAVARAAGLKFRETGSEKRTVRRVVVGGEPKNGQQLQRRQPCDPYSMLSSNSATANGGVYPVFEYTMSMDIGQSYASLMKADQTARTRTYDPKQQYTSDVLFEVPPSSIVSGSKRETKQIDQVSLDAFQPSDAEHLFVLSGYADVSRPVAAKLMRPVNMIEHGERVGKLAATRAAQQSAPRDPEVTGSPTDQPAAEGDVREVLAGTRPIGRPETVPQSSRAIPVLGTYEVVVIGGGTGGAPAGIGAARQGAKTLVVEYLAGLGGVSTEGAIAGYYWGNRVGFTSTVLDGATRWEVEPKKEWYRRELLKAGADIWFGSIGCGAFVEGDRVRGAVVTTPHGRGVVLANTVIDATGNSDVAAAAGADCDYTDESEFGMQGTGLPGRRLGGSYNNTDFTIVDETDMLDTWHVFVYSKEKYPGAFDHGRLIDTRERRRIVGDHRISILDQLNERTYPDIVTSSWSNFDTHGYTVHPYFLLEHPEKKGIAVHIPLRAMLPKGLKGMIVTGLSISAHRDAVPLIRMQADIQNGGYAAGVAAAMASDADTTIRHIDIEALQEHLVEIGNLPESVLEHEDSFPLSDEAFAEAVRKLPSGRGAAVLLTDPERALPLVKKAYRDAQGTDDRLAYARALATLGADDGVETLIKAVEGHAEWDEGWNYRGMGQFGSALSPLDVLIIQLGMTKNPEVLPTILKKTVQLDAEHEFSHHRAAGLALEKLGHPAAARPLANLLEKPGMTGYVHSSIDIAKELAVGGGTNAVKSRRESLRELLLARALYRCGDYREGGNAS